MNEAIIQVTVRLLVGIVCAAIGAFFGALLIAMIFSSADTSNSISSTTRLIFIAITATIFSRLGWFGIIETRTQSITMLLTSVFFGIIGAGMALATAGIFFEHTDLYILNRNISGAGFLGTVFACNIPTLIFAIKLARNREI